MGFVEITQDEIQHVPEQYRLPAHEIDFELLVQAEKFDWRNNKKLKKVIEK